MLGESSTAPRERPIKLVETGNSHFFVGQEPQNTKHLLPFCILCEVPSFKTQSLKASAHSPTRTPQHSGIRWSPCFLFLPFLKLSTGAMQNCTSETCQTKPNAMSLFLSLASATSLTNFCFARSLFHQKLFFPSTFCAVCSPALCAPLACLQFCFHC